MSLNPKGFRRPPKLSLAQHEEILSLAEKGNSPGNIAKKIGVSIWAVNRHIEAGSYELESPRPIVAPAIAPPFRGEAVIPVVSANPVEGSGEWTTDNGFFWIYFNTRRGWAPPKVFHIERENKPWVIRKFADRDSWQNNMVKHGTYKDTFAAQIRRGPYPLLGISSFETVYIEQPPWGKNTHNPIASVRGYLKVEGVIQYR